MSQLTLYLELDLNEAWARAQKQRGQAVATPEKEGSDLSLSPNKPQSLLSHNSQSSGDSHLSGLHALATSLAHHKSKMFSYLKHENIEINSFIHKYIIFTLLCVKSLCGKPSAIGTTNWLFPSEFYRFIVSWSRAGSANTKPRPIAQTMVCTLCLWCALDFGKQSDFLSLAGRLTFAM